MRLLDKCLLYRLPNVGPTTIRLPVRLSRLTFPQAGALCGAVVGLPAWLKAVSHLAGHLSYGAPCVLLMINLRSTGPVISTYHSLKSPRIGAARLFELLPSQTIIVAFRHCQSWLTFPPPLKQLSSPAILHEVPRLAGVTILYCPQSVNFISGRRRCCVISLRPGTLDRGGCRLRAHALNQRWEISDHTGATDRLASWTSDAGRSQTHTSWQLGTAATGGRLCQRAIRLGKVVDRGDNVSTEDLRVAPPRGRSYFDRLLKL
jgi:hypothetical protein